MIKIEDIQIEGWDAAIRGMRNPMNSWDKDDREWIVDDGRNDYIDRDDYNIYIVGKDNLSLMKRLCASGTDHRKFMRFVTVSMDITAPLYWWKEFDTYKVGTVANSCSTMHKIAAKEFVRDDFSSDHLFGHREDDTCSVDVSSPISSESCLWSPSGVLDIVIRSLNLCRDRYLETKDKKYWWQMIQLLPSSYNQKRTVLLNYEVLANMYKSRKDHKLDEWQIFCETMKGLPYSFLFTNVKDEEIE